MRRTSAWRFGLAALLGLPAALFAHALIFGSDHAAGGSVHAGVIDLACLFGGICAAMVAGQALRARVAARPSYAGAALAAATWFALIELCEQPHAIPFVTAAAVLAAAAWIVRAVFCAFAVAAVTVAVVLRASRAPNRQRSFRLTYAEQPCAVTRAHRLRLFSRPPPLFA